MKASILGQHWFEPMATFTVVFLKDPSIWAITIVKLHIVPCSTHTLKLPSLHKSFIPFDGLTYMPIFPCVNPSHDQDGIHNLLFFYLGGWKENFNLMNNLRLPFHPSIHPSRLFLISPRLVWQYLVILGEIYTFNSQSIWVYPILLLNDWCKFVYGSWSLVFGLS